MGNPQPHFVSRIRPNPAAVLESRVEPAALPCPLPQSRRRDADSSGSGFDVLDKSDVFLHGAIGNVIFHRKQMETSHSPYGMFSPSHDYMTESEEFRNNLLRLMAEKGLKAAELSRMAGLNPRAVKDIEEQRVTSPKLSTVIALARALQADPAQMMGLRPLADLRPELLSFLARYDVVEQEQLLLALSALLHRPA